MTPSDGRARRTAAPVTRRQLLRTAGGVVAAGAVAPSAGAAPPPSFGGWFDDVSNYDGVVDERGERRVTVTVGVEANDGYFGFGPAAVRVSPGTTVVWEWNGRGGSHNVVDSSGTFESELTAREGHTFSYTFQEPGVYKYYCAPHEALGMKGAVVVGDVEAGERPSGAAGDGEPETGPTGGGLDLARVSTRDALVVTLLGAGGLAVGLALAPDVGPFASAASRPATRTGYVVHRLNRFRDSWTFSVVVGWLSFLAVLVALGALFVALWHVGGGPAGFLAALAALAAVVAWYVHSSGR